MFKNYLKWKCLHYWYKHISWNKFYWAREDIISNLSILTLRNDNIKSLFETAIEVSGIIYEAMEMNMYDGSIVEENTLHSFREQQVCLYCIKKI